MLHTIAISLKIPDNTAYSALTTLRRLGVAVESIERADIWQLEDERPADELIASVKRNETLFNPNKHVLESRTQKPLTGEVWIEEIAPRERAGTPKHYVGWRLFTASKTPADPATVEAAIEKLLCNPAIERAILS